MKATFDSTIAILVKAYLNDTLRHKSCTCCAVGNLIATANNYLVASSDAFWKSDGRHIQVEWDEVFCTGGSGWSYFLLENYQGEAKRQIDSTGYTVDQLAQIEKAFETCPYAYNQDEHMFNGLMAVVDVLAKIHNVDLTTAQEAKALFVKPSL